MRSAAQVLPIALPVQADRLARRDGADDLGLVVLADFLEVRHRFIARQHAPVHRQILGGNLGHALFDRREILGRERPFVRKIVVEAVLDDRADGDLGVGKQLLYGIRQEVRGGMPDDLEAVGVLIGHYLQGGVMIDERGSVDQLPINLAGKRRLGKPGSNARGNLRHGDRAIKAFLTSVRKSNNRHRCILPKGIPPGAGNDGAR